MRKVIGKKIISAAIFLAISNLCYAQIIQVNEIDLSNKSFESIRNSDINSRIYLKLDTSVLLKKLGTSGIAKIPDNIMNLVKILTETLEKKNEMLSSFDQAIKEHKLETGNAESLKNASEFNRKMKTITSQIVILFALDPVLDDLYAVEAGRVVGLVNPIFPAIERRLQLIDQELLSAGIYNDVRIRIGAWLIHKGQKTALHFEGLDNNPQSEFYEVDRWRFLPTPEQIKELEALQKLSRESNFKEADFLELLKGFYLEEFKRLLSDQLNALIEQIKTEIQSIIQSPEAATVKILLSEIETEGNNLISLFKLKFAFYVGLKTDESFTLTSLLSSISSDVAAVNSSAKNLHDKLLQLKNNVAADAPAIKTKFNNLIKVVEEGLKQTQNSILAGLSLSELQSTAKLPDEALEFSDMVLSLALHELPAEMSTDLRNAGYREDGDQVVVKLTVSNQTTNKIIIQDSRNIKLYRFAFHLEGTVGVIFAHPLSQTAIEKDFQMAPYYNLLFKGLCGSKASKRKATLPNNLFALNPGLHISSPDFNKDDVPELGVGIVLSTLMDYVQVGWAYNLFAGKNYVFFGIRLPVPSMNFGSNGQSGNVNP